MTYRFLEHTADVKFLAEGASLKEMFISASDALNETIRGKIDILEQEEKTIEITGEDLENLLYKFLEEFIFLLDAQDFLISRVKEIEINEKSFTLKAKITGDKASNYKFTNDVKAVTYNELFIKRENDKFFCQVVLDV